MKFLKELPLYQTVQPYKLHGYPDLADELQTNCVYEEVDDIQAEDLRISKRDCHFDVEGFEYIRAPSRCRLTAETFETDGDIENAVVQAYIEETMATVQRRLRAHAIFTIDWRVT